MTSTDIRFTDLGAPRRIWAVSAIHGELEKLYAMHDAILERLQAGDRIVYLGNYTGRGTKARETVEEILTFRRLALSLPGMKPSDIIYLRGLQEDLWQQLLQLQFANKPDIAYASMLNQGLGETLESYGIAAYDGIRACREGVLALTRWTAKIRYYIRQYPGHDIFMTQYRRAAFTGKNGRFPLLFVHAGINPERPLEAQGDSLWQPEKDFSEITQMYAPFEKIIRGYDPSHSGVRINCVTASLDGGCGFGGQLVCAGLDSRGTITELMHV